MPDPVFTIDIVAHRLFGSIYHSVVERRVTRTGGVFEPGFAGSLRRPLVLLPTLDHEHGTSRSEAEVRALFSRDPAYTYEGDLTLNDIFEPLGVRFALLRVVDDPIDSHLADFVLHSAVQGIARQHNIRHVLNVYFIRDIDGAYGIAKPYSRHGQYPTYAFVADRLVGTPERRFALSLLTLAHELGHVLALPHMPGARNLMHNWGSPDRLTFEAPQIHIARQQASLMVAGQRLFDPRDLDRHLPRVRPYPDWLV